MGEFFDEWTPPGVVDGFRESGTCQPRDVERFDCDRLVFAAQPSSDLADEVLAQVARFGMDFATLARAFALFLESFTRRDRCRWARASFRCAFR